MIDYVTADERCGRYRGDSIFYKVGATILVGALLMVICFI